MQQSIQRSGVPCPDLQPTECHHSREPFDTGFRCINRRTDISPTAKLVYHRLVSQYRMLARGQGEPATQAQIGEDIGCSRHQVWRALGELVAYGLVEVHRHGQGKPSTYTLHGIDAENLSGKASRPAGHQEAGQSGGTTRTHSFKNNRKSDGYTGGRGRGSSPIPQTSSAYLETRDGRLRPR